MGAPRWQHDRELLAAVAAHLYQQRVDGYPELVAAGRLKPEVAATGIRIMGAVAADWKAVAALEPEPVGIHDPEQGGAHKWERVEALAGRATQARAAAEACPDAADLTGLADAVDTLLWWETANPPVRWLADMTLELRARARADLAEQPAPARTWRKAA